jgi:hypothetical protein
VPAEHHHRDGSATCKDGGRRLRRPVADETGAAFGDPDTGTSIGVKCGRNRDEADEWTARYPEDAEASFEAVDASYLDIVSRLPKKERPPTGPETT